MGFTWRYFGRILPKWSASWNFIIKVKLLFLFCWYFFWCLFLVIYIFRHVFRLFLLIINRTHHSWFFHFFNYPINILPYRKNMIIILPIFFVIFKYLPLLSFSTISFYPLRRTIIIKIISIDNTMLVASLWIIFSLKSPRFREGIGSFWRRPIQNVINILRRLMFVRSCH
jgi:hypothetical protein